MKPTCNINPSGARQRLVSGVVMTGLGITSLALALFHTIGSEHAPWPAIAAAFLLAIGALSIYQGIQHW